MSMIFQFDFTYCFKYCCFTESITIIFDSFLKIKRLSQSDNFTPKVQSCLGRLIEKELELCKVFNSFVFKSVIERFLWLGNFVSKMQSCLNYTKQSFIENIINKTLTIVLYLSSDSLFIFKQIIIL